MGMILRILPLFIMFLLSLALALGLFNKEPESAVVAANTGKSFPQFEIQSLTKDTVFSPTLFPSGQVVAVNVFASWCEPCKAEHKTLMKLAQKVNIYGIAWKDKPEKAFEFLKELGNPFQDIGVDEEGKTTTAMGLSGVPETFIINKKGQIALHYKAPLTDDLVENSIIPLIEKLNKEDVKAQ